MWVNKQLFDMIVADNKSQADQMALTRGMAIGSQTVASELRSQKVRDDLNIDWLRHRVNALEKVNAQLLAKAAGIFIPVPEIVPTRPGSMTEPPDFDSMPSFEDVGDAEAERLGITHDLDGTLVYEK